MVTLPGLKDMIDGISRERNLPKLAVQTALREALLKGYERYRRTQRIDNPNFDEEYFANFEVELDVEEEGFRVLAAKTIVEEVDNPDHQIALEEVQEVAAEAQPGDTVVLDVTPDRVILGGWQRFKRSKYLPKNCAISNASWYKKNFKILKARSCRHGCYGLSGNLSSWRSTAALDNPKSKQNC
jgi:N utilization substance protein A